MFSFPTEQAGRTVWRAVFPKAYRGEDTDSLSVVFVRKQRRLQSHISGGHVYEHGSNLGGGRPAGKKMVQGVEDVRDIFRYQKPDVIVLETDCMFRGKSPEKSAEQSSPAEKGAVEKASKYGKASQIRGESC